MKFKDFLTEIYDPFNPEQWVERNGYPLWAAKEHGLAIAGSIAIAIARKKAIRKPGDLDFVASSRESAEAFIAKLQSKLFDYKTYWSVSINHQTDFCPPNCTTHFRIKTGFWLPICVMVIPVERFQIWRTHGGYIVQNFNTVVEAAADLDKRDNKGRIDGIPIIDPRPEEFEEHIDPPVSVVEPLEDVEDFGLILRPTTYEEHEPAVASSYLDNPKANP